MSSTNRRSFLARGAALAAVPTVAALAGGVLADRASADALPSYAPVPRQVVVQAGRRLGHLRAHLRGERLRVQRPAPRRVGLRPALPAIDRGGLVSLGPLVGDEPPALLAPE